jgi:aerobic-type carbon monoxide dehydrogenase small subunit (CoxS/CutS family)
MSVVRLRVNGAAIAVEADGLTPLQAILRDDLGLRSVRAPCGVGACGACTVLLDDEPVRSCLVPVGIVRGREVRTNEGLPDDHPVRAAFVAQHAYQCGYCIPGFVLSATALLRADPRPTPAAIDAGLAGNLCRCGSYAAIRRAVGSVGELVATRGPASGNHVGRVAMESGATLADQPDGPRDERSTGEQHEGR